MKDIDAILLVGGKGTRLKSIIEDSIPKPMAKVAGRPFVDWLLISLYNQGVRRVVMCTEHLNESIETYFRNGEARGIEIVYSHEPFPAGTAGALRCALNKIDSERFIVMNGDSYCRLDLSFFLATHKSRHARASLSVVRVEDCSRYGTIKIDEEGRVLTFLEKSSGRSPGLINAGIYLLEREVLEEIPEGKMVSLEKEVFPKLIGKGLYALLSEGPFVDIGTPESYIKAEDILKDEFEQLHKDFKLI